MKLATHEMTQNNRNETRTIVQTFDELTTRDLYEILKVRAAVFVVEQRCSYLDMDGIDFRSNHVIIWHDNQIVAYCRVFKDEEPGAWHVGRVLTTQRKKNYGLQVMREAIKVAESLGARTVKIEAQSYAIGFYEKVGFQVCSDEFLIDDILHKRMRLQVAHHE